MELRSKLVAVLLFCACVLPAALGQRCPAKCVCPRRNPTTVRCMYAQLVNVPLVPPDTTVLDLRYNRIKTLTPGIFSRAPNLKTILLNNNQIKRLEADTFSGLQDLQYLYLYKNQIEDISADAFKGLPNLEQLYIHFNKLETLRPETFNHLPKLERLFLHNNRLQRLPSGLFTHLNSLKRLRLDSNALICDCGIMWLTELLKEKQGTEAAATCQEPLEIEGRPIVSMTGSDLQCKKPEFTVTPEDVEVTVGTLATFYCQASGDPKPEIHWLRNNEEISKNEVDSRISIEEDGTLTIRDTQNTDQGTYECVAKNAVGESKTQGVQLKYQGDPVPTELLKAPSDFTVVEGDTIALECQASGHPRPVVTWSRNGQPLPEDPRLTILASGTLFIANIQFSDRGRYTCQAANELRTVSAVARVLVQVKPTFTTRPSDQSSIAGGEVSFSCRATGQPRPLILWYRNGTPIRNSRYSLNRDRTILKVADIQESDVGEVECRAENRAGRITTTAKLSLKPKTAPQLTTSPTSQLIPAGISIELTCRAEGAPTPTIRWLHNNQPVQADARHAMSPHQLVITEIRHDEQGIYTCVAENEVGSVQATANVTVLDERRTFPGDRFLNNSLEEARREVDQAFNQTQRNLHDRNRRKTPEDLLALFRYPTIDTIPLSRAWEVFERTLELIVQHTREGEMVNVTEEVDYRELISPSHLAVLANLSGCAAHRKQVNCNNMCYHHKYRTVDGTCNNLQHPMWGASLTPLKRMLPPVYENGFNSPVGWNRNKLYKGFRKPSARSVSLNLMSTGSITPDKDYTHMLMQWGQFVDHDLDFTPMAISTARFSDGRLCNETCDNQAPCFPIPIPSYDPRIRRHQCIGVTRSSGICNSGMTSVFYKQLQPRQQVNQITSFLDASNVYGSSEEELRHLRDSSDRRGLMRIGLIMPSGKGLLPPNDVGAAVDCQMDPNADHVPCFLAGDHRGNEQLGLLAMHTVWMREHNRIAKTLFNLNPHWDQDMLFHEARKIVGAEMQHITFTEWLPKFIGAKGMEMVGTYKNYDPNVDSSVTNAFATAAYRVGHTLINPIIYRLNASFQPIPQGNLALHRAFFAPWRLVEEGGVDPLLRGLIGVSAKRMMPGEYLNLELTEKLFKLAHEVALDLAALNIQRGRDHGLPSYNAYRKWCGLPEAETFDELSDEITSEEVRDKLQQLYGHPDNIDLFVGGVAETPVEDAKMGPTFRCIIADQFKRIRDGDRFWYENPGVFEPAQLTQIKRTTLGRVICDNSDHIEEVQYDVFRTASYPRDMVKCDKLPFVDLKIWTQCCHDCNRAGEFNSITSHFGRRLTNRFSFLNDRGDQSLNIIQPAPQLPLQNDDRRPGPQPTRPHGSRQPTLPINQTIVPDSSEESDEDTGVEIRQDELMGLRLDSMEEELTNMKKNMKNLKRKIKRLETKMELSVRGSTDCVDQVGSIHKDGEKWSAGKCKKCKCENGQIECDREVCPPVNCPSPQVVPGECCPVC